MSKVDVVIVGGGAVGSVIARGLIKRTHFSVALVEANAYASDSFHPGFDARVIALSKRTVDELTTLGVDLSHTGAVPIRHIQVSDKGAAGLCNLHADEFHVDSFGRVIALQRLGEALQLPTDNERFTLHCPAQISTVTRHQDNVTVTLDTGQTIETKLLILADGGRSALHQQLGFERTSEPYGQTAIIVNVLTQVAHQHRAYERFTAQGPVAFLPYDPGLAAKQENDHGFSVVWTVPPGQVEQVMQASDDVFIRKLQQAFGWRQGAITQIGERTAYPLSLQQTHNPVNHRSVVCGNAAQTLHPIAGQGFNLGLRDAIALVDTLTEQHDPGQFSLLRQYALRRQADKSATITLTDGLVRLFSNKLPGLIAARNIGLVAMDNSALLKQHFVRQTTGFAPGA